MGSIHLTIRPQLCYALGSRFFKSLVLICRWPTWDIYRRHNLSQALTAGVPAKLS